MVSMTISTSKISITIPTSLQYLPVYWHSKTKADYRFIMVLANQKSVNATVTFNYTVDVDLTDPVQKGRYKKELEEKVDTAL